MDFCIACKKEADETGLCIGRLCYQCIEEAVIIFKSIEKKKITEIDKNFYK